MGGHLTSNLFMRTETEQIRGNVQIQQRPPKRPLKLLAM